MGAVYTLSREDTSCETFAKGQACVPKAQSPLRQIDLLHTSLLSQPPCGIVGFAATYNVVGTSCHVVQFGGIDCGQAYI